MTSHWAVSIRSINRSRASGTLPRSTPRWHERRSSAMLTLAPTRWPSDFGWVARTFRLYLSAGTDWHGRCGGRTVEGEALVRCISMENQHVKIKMY